MSVDYMTPEDVVYLSSGGSKPQVLYDEYAFSLANQIVFNNNTGSAQPLKNAYMHVTDVEIIDKGEFKLEYIFENEKIYVYAVNNGWYPTDQYITGYQVQSQYSEWNQKEQKFDKEDFFYSINDVVDSPSESFAQSNYVELTGAQITLVATFELSAEKISSILDNTKSFYISVTAFTNENGIEKLYSLGNYSVERNVVVEEGGMGGPMAYTETCVFLDVDAGEQVVSVYSMIDMQVVEDAEAYIISIMPNKHSRITYYFEFEIGSQTLTTQPCQVEIYAPVFMNNDYMGRHSHTPHEMGITNYDGTEMPE